MPSQSSTPRRTPSAAMYRRRRIAVAVAALLALALLAGAVALVSSLLRGAPGAGEQPAPEAASSSDAPAPSAAPASSEPPECEPSDLRLTAATDRPEYDRGQEAELSLEITNLSSTPCRRDVGTAEQEFVVRTGAGAEVFSTRTCQEGPTHQEMVLEPHRPQTAVYRWGGRRGLADCSRLGEPAAAGPHLLTVALGDVTSRPAAFRITEEVVASARPTPSSTPTTTPTPGAPAASSGSSTGTPRAGSSAPASSSPAGSSATGRPSGPASRSAAPSSSPARAGRSGAASPAPTVTVTVSAPPTAPGPSPSR